MEWLTTGVITIPLMQKAGFRGRFAAGVEAASSTGGQLMPPIMGAGAFVMATLTQISYEYIVVVAALPALLYFLSVAFFVRIEARRLDMQPMPVEGRSLGQALKDGGKGGLNLEVAVGELPQASLQATYVAIARP